MKRLTSLAVPALLVLVALLAARAAAGPRATLVGTPTMKVQVNKDGWYRVPAATLTSAGFVAPADPNLLHLRMNGADVPFQYHSGAVEFYGQGLDTIYTDTRTYYLSLEATEGAHMSFLRARTPAGAATGSYTAVLNAADRTAYLGGLLTDVGNSPGAVPGNNWFGDGIFPNFPYTKTLDVGKAETSQQASLLVHLHGMSNTSHNVQLSVNNVPVGPAMIWSGIGDFSTTISGITLQQGLNTFKFTSNAAAGDFVDTDTYSLTYQHLYTADGDRLNLTVAAGTPVSIDGFTSSNVRLIDTTNPTSPRELFPTISGSGAWTISFNPPAGTTRVYAFADATQAFAPTNVVQDAPSTLKSASNTADLIIIGYKDAGRDFLADVQPLANLRASASFAVKVVDVEDVYDEFGTPLGAKGADAIKSFLQYAKNNWSSLANPDPKYVLLAGDATVDPRGYQPGTLNKDYIPTQFIDASYSHAPADDSMSDFNGDGKPELAVGRLPVQTDAEASLVVSKIVGYDATGPRPETALLVSDRPEDASDYTFANFTADLKTSSLTPNGVTVTPANEIVRPAGTGGDVATRNQIITQASTGPILVNWFGHGSFGAWRGDVLRKQDAATITNSGALSLYLGMTCQNAYFVQPGVNGIGEALLLATNAAVAFWGSTGDTIPGDQINAAKVATAELFGAPPARLGDAMLDAKNAIFDIDVLHTWTLLGDPTMKLRI